MSDDLEAGTDLQLDFGKIDSIANQGSAVIPAVAQDVETGRVLMVGFANQQALTAALERKQAVFWSTSRDELWIKGKTSGDVLALEEVRVNCEQNSLLYLVRPQGEGTCHTKDADGRHRPSCYYRRIKGHSLEHAPYEPVWKE